MSPHRLTQAPRLVARPVRRQDLEGACVEVTLEGAHVLVGNVAVAGMFHARIAPLMQGRPIAETRPTRASWRQRRRAPMRVAPRRALNRTVCGPIRLGAR